MSKEYFDKNMQLFLDEKCEFAMYSLAYEYIDKLEQHIKSLEAQLSNTEQLTCDGCKHYDGSHKCNNVNSIAWETSNRVYPDDYCKDFESHGIS